MFRAHPTTSTHPAHYPPKSLAVRGTCTADVGVLSGSGKTNTEHRLELLEEREAGLREKVRVNADAESVQVNLPLWDGNRPVS